MNNASPLHFAAFAACPKLVGALLDAGCRGDHVNDHGGSALTNAAANPTTTPELLARLRKKGGAGFCLNCVARPRTRKWLLIDRAAEAAYRHNLVPKTDLVTHLANSRGSTALHDAAKLGHISTVTCSGCATGWAVRLSTSRISSAPFRRWRRYSARR